MRRAAEVAPSQECREKHAAGDEASAESVSREIEGTGLGVGEIGAVRRREGLRVGSGRLGGACPAWLCSRPHQPARHASFCGFHVDELTGEPPQAQGDGGACHSSSGSFTRSHLPRARLVPGGSVCCGLSSPPDPSCFPCGPSRSHHRLPALRGLQPRSVPLCGFSSFCRCSRLGAGRRQHRQPAKWRPEASNGLFPLFRPESGSLPRVISHTSCEHCTVVRTRM